MKKVFVLLTLYLSSHTVWSSGCTEYASVLVGLKLKDMISSYGGKYYYDLNKDKYLPIKEVNPYGYKHICNRPEIRDTLTSLKKEFFKSCSLSLLEDSLDQPPGSLTNESLTTIVTRYIDGGKCSPVVIRRMEDRLLESVPKIEDELIKDAPNLETVCESSRQALFKNYEAREKCH